MSFLEKLFHKNNTIQNHKEEKIMKIAVVCANGKAGQLIVKEALSRNLDVTAIVRNENKSNAKRLLQRICLI